MESQKLNGEKKNPVEKFVNYVQFWPQYDFLLVFLPLHHCYFIK